MSAAIARHFHVFAISQHSRISTAISLQVQDQPGATSQDISPDKAADEVRNMAKEASTDDSFACLG